MKSSFTLFGITFYPYSLLMIAGAGVFLGLFAFFTMHRHRDCYDENVFAIEMLLVSTAAALPAAMLLDSLFKWQTTGRFSFGGATFYGGLLGALSLFPLLLLLKKCRQISIYERLCDLAPAIPAGHALGRIGCFFGGCCFGKPTESIFGVIFPEGSIPFEFYGRAVAVHPTQLYEAFFLVLLFVFLWQISRWKHGKNTEFPLYLICYGVLRFVIEFLRNDERGALIPMLSPAQTISLCLFMLGGILLAVRFLKMRKYSRES